MNRNGKDAKQTLEEELALGRMKKVDDQLEIKTPELARVCEQRRRLEAENGQLKSQNRQLEDANRHVNSQAERLGAENVQLTSQNW